MDESKELRSLGWCILEIMGHRKLGGEVREEALFGGVLLRIDIPSTPPMTQFYGASSVFCLTPTNEETARAVAATFGAQPVNRWELPAAPPSPGSYQTMDPEDEERFDPDEDIDPLF